MCAQSLIDKEVLVAAAGKRKGQGFELKGFELEMLCLLISCRMLIIYQDNWSGEEKKRGEVIKKFQH